MRDYLLRVWKDAGTVVTHPSTFRATMQKRPVYIAAAFLLVLVAVFGALQIAKADSTSTLVTNNNAVTAKTSVQTSTQTGQVDSTPQAVTEGGQDVMTAPDTSQTSSSSTQTSVTVNGQQVDVPQNGSVSKTIQSDSGTTTVNITNSSTSSGSGGSSSHMLNVNTVSQAANAVNNAAQINRYIH